MTQYGRALSVNATPHPHHAGVLLAAAMVLASAPALADVTKQQCIDANSKAQDLRREGKLSASKEQLRVCGSPSCPALVRDDCAKRLDDLERAQPTVVFEAKDGSGNGSAPLDSGGPQDATSNDGSLRGDASDSGSSSGGADGGNRDVGSCCSAQTTPGCDNATLEACVCQIDPTCCTTAWTPACTLIVAQKYCQPGVRECVCGSDAGEWGQTSCCTTSWMPTCDNVATQKCGASAGCF